MLVKLLHVLSLVAEDLHDWQVGGSKEVIRNKRNYV